MDVRYRHANPDSGQESFYIKFSGIFDDPTNSQTACILVDSGEGVNTKKDLGQDEYLAGILLTHAHYDHYATLPKNIINSASVYTSPDTASIIETSMSEQRKFGNLSGEVGVAMDALTPITGWEQVMKDIEIRPIPVGHAPGSSGFLIRFTDGGESKTILATGDFNFPSVAGYPGMPKSFPTDVDVLFMNSATQEENPINEALQGILEQSKNGSQVLLAAPGLTGVHYAYLLGHLLEEINHSASITIIGHVAKLYNELGYDVPNVTSVGTFDSPKGMISRGDIAIAGRKYPDKGTAKIIYDAFIKDDPSAALVKLTSSGYNDFERGACTVLSYDYQNHPSEQELHDFVETLSPIHTVIEHGNTDRYNDVFDFTFTWANRDTDTYTLYQNSEWTGPRWIQSGTESMIKRNNANKKYANSGQIIGSFNEPQISDLPVVEKYESVDLEREGIDMRVFEKMKQNISTPTTMNKNREKHGSSPVGSHTVSSQKPSSQMVTEVASNDSVSQSREQILSLAQKAGEIAKQDGEIDDGEVGSILQQLYRIEQILMRESVDASVIDAGQGDIFLRVDDSELKESVQHGDTVTVQIGNPE